MDDTTNDRTHEVLLSWPQVRLRLASLSRTAFWRLRKNDPTFPTTVPIGPRRVGWRESEIESWIADQAAKVSA